MTWRVVNQIDIYDGERLVCHCERALDAALIVKAVNAIVTPEDYERVFGLSNAEPLDCKGVDPKSTTGKTTRTK